MGRSDYRNNPAIRDGGRVPVPPIPEVPESDNPSGSGNSNSSVAPVQLQRSLRLHNGVAMIVGCIVGSGIFITPTGVLKEVGSAGASLIVWLLCGIISTLGAYCYCELGTMITESGGDYAYIKNAFGKFLSFLCLWGYVMVICPTGNAVMALTFAKYTLYPFVADCVDEGFAVTVLAIIVTCLLTFINCANVNWANNAQVVFTITKVLALTIIVIVGFVQLSTSRSVGSFSDVFGNTHRDPARFAYGFYQGIFSFSGWNALNFLTEELQSPDKNLPRAVWISMPLVTIVYLLVNCAYFIVLGIPEVLGSSAIAITFAKDRLAGLHWLIPIFVALSTVGSLNGSIYISSRLFFVGARDSLMPDFLALINYRKKTPIPALIFQCIISLVYLVIGGREIEKLINFCSFSELAFITFSLLGMLFLKWRQPKRHRPVNVHPILPAVLLVFFVYSLFAPMIGDSKEKVLIGIVVLISGAPFYVICLYFLRKQQAVRLSLSRLTLLVQKLFLCVPESVSYQSNGSVTTPQREVSFIPNDDLDSGRPHKSNNVSSSSPMQTMRTISGGSGRGISLTEDAIPEEDEEDMSEEDYAGTTNNSAGSSNALGAQNTESTLSQRAIPGSNRVHNNNNNSARIATIPGSPNYSSNTAKQPQSYR